MRKNWDGYFGVSTLFMVKKMLQWNVKANITRNKGENRG